MPHPGEPSLSADSPIERATEDLLERDGFVRALADDVRNAPRRSGFVIGLTAPWGSGKTSVLEMVGSQLGAEDVTAVVRFNPWLFSGTEQLVEHFFTELSGQLEATASETVGKIAKALRVYGRVVSPLRYLPYVGEIAKVSSEAASDAGTALAGDEKSTARARAEDLRERLGELERPVVILIDDLDRLRAEEIVDVVRLVRLVGDFPNLVYLMAFDRPAVETALGDGTRLRGRGYLEKIIHLCHDLPPIRPEDLTEVIDAAVTEAVPDSSVYRFDQGRHTNLFWTEVRPMFTTVRDVRRYRNVLTTALRLLGDEVDLTDVLALEALRLFEPEFFEAIYESRDLLTGRLSSQEALRAALRVGEDAVTAARVRELAATPTRNANPGALLRRLFPQCAKYLEGPPEADAEESKWRALRRVADPEVFDTYLYRRLSPGTLPAREVEGVVSAFGDEARLNEIFDGLETGELRSLLDRLVNYRPEVNAEMAAPTINAILRQSDRLAGGSFSEVTGSLMVYEIFRGLQAEDIVMTFERLSFPSLSNRYEILRLVGRGESGEGRLIGEEDARRLEGDLREAILGASAEQLATEADVGPLFNLLRDSDGSTVAARLSEWTRDDRFFVSLLTAHRITSMAQARAGEPVVRSVQLLWPSAVETFGLPELRRGLTAIDLSWVEGEFDDDTVVAWKQALGYLEDPESGIRDSARYEAI